MKKEGLFTAFILVLISIFILVSTSFAWFTVKKEVSISSFELTAQTSTNLYISLDGVNFFESVTFENTSDYGRFLPASSINGYDNSFFTAYAYNEDGEANVFTLASQAVLKNPAKNGYYLDIPIWFKNKGTESANNIYLDINGNFKSTITKITTDIYKAVRVAFLNEQKNAPSYLSEPLIWAPSGVSVLAATENAMPTQNQVVFNTSTPLTGEILLNEQNVVKIIARIWIEGQDVNCKPQNSGGEFKINLHFEAK